MPVLITLGHHCSDKEQSAEWAEREVIKIKLLHFLNKSLKTRQTEKIASKSTRGMVQRQRKNLRVTLRSDLQTLR